MDNNMNSSVENKMENKNIFAYVLVVFFAMFIGSGLFLMMNSNKSKQTTSEVNNISVDTQKEQVSEVNADGASLNVQSDLPNNSTAVSTEFSLDLLADSKDKNVVGYDVVLSYDSLAFEFVKADSLLTDYKIYSYKKDNYITLTATKNLQSPATPMTKEKIARLFFKPTKPGQYSFTLKSLNGNEKTDFITDETEILKPALNDLIINVK